MLAVWSNFSTIITFFFTVVLLFLPSSSENRNFYPVNSCTDIKLKDIPLAVFQKCSETNSAIHCLSNENNNLGLSCFQVTWISEGKIRCWTFSCCIKDLWKIYLFQNNLNTHILIYSGIISSVWFLLIFSGNI